MTYYVSSGTLNLTKPKPTVGGHIKNISFTSRCIDDFGVILTNVAKCTQNSTQEATTQFVQVYLTKSKNHIVFPP